MNDQFFITNMESKLLRRIDALGKNQDAHFRHIEKLIARASNGCVLVILSFIVGILLGHLIF